jgi:four helix bundle protein
MFAETFGMINNQAQTQTQYGRVLRSQKSLLMNKIYDLENRLVAFSCDMIGFLGSLPVNYAAERIKEQLIRSSMSSALNYGEAQAAESQRDFRHKLSIVLKELKESRVGIKIISRLGLGTEDARASLGKECDELIAIFATIIKRTVF